MSVSLEFDHSIGNNAVPNCLCYHPNKENYIYGSGWSVGIGSLTDIHSQEFLRQHDDAVTCIALSNSGSLIASGQKGHNADIVVWSFDQRKAIYSFEEHDFGIVCLSFSPDEKLLASVGNDEDGKLIIWDLSNGCIVAASPKLPQGTTSVACGGFVRNIKRRETEFYQFCTAGNEGLVIWELNPYTGEMVSNKFVGDPRASITRRISGISFSSDQLTVYCATSSGDYLCGSVRARKITHAIMAAKKGLGAVHRFKDGLITGGGDGSVKVFSNDDRVLGETVLDGPILDISLSPDSLEVIASTALGSIFRINVQTMNHLVVAESHRDYVVATAFSDRYGDKFATASRDGTVRTWDVVEYSVTSIGYAHPHQLRGSYPVCLDFTDIVVSGWTDGSILAHDIDSGANLWYIEKSHVDGISALKLSHNMRFLLSGGELGEVRLWELRTRELISHMKEHTQRITDIEIFFDDSQALTSSKDKSIMLWSLKDEKRIQCYLQRMGGINSIALSLDQTQIISMGQEKKINFWELGSTSPIHSAFVDDDWEHEEGLCLVRSHDGEVLVSGGSSGIVRMWSFHTGKQLAEVVAHSGHVTGVAFSLDDRQVVSTGADGSISIWCVFK